MEQNDTVSAPNIEGFEQAYDVWRVTHVGNFDDFFVFMSTPTVERDRFMDSIGARTELYADVVCQNAMF